MEIIKFTEAVFASKGMKGIITPDSDGYFTVVVGALNTYNSAGEYYTAQGATELFNSSSIFMRRIKNGALYAEVGHPKRLPGMSNDEFYNRVLSIEKTNVCGHISEITLDPTFGAKNPELNNPELIAIIAKVKPAGPKAEALRIALENPKQNSAFSIRALTENKFRNGRVERRLTTIVTFDFVLEPGISVATKAMSPGLESREERQSYSVKEVSDTTVDRAVLANVLKRNMEFVGMESNSRALYDDVLKSLAPRQVKNKLSDW